MFQSEMFENAFGAFVLGMLILTAIAIALFNKEARSRVYSFTHNEKILVLFVAMALIGMFCLASFDLGANSADEKLLMGVSPEQRKAGNKIEAGIIIAFEKSGPKIKLKPGTTVPTN